MRTKDDQALVWVYPVTKLFPDGDSGEGGGNGGEGGGGNPPSTPSTPPVTPGTNWEAAYKTLQRNHNDLQAQVATLSGQNETLTAQLATRAEEHSGLNGQLEAANLQVTDLTSQLTTISGERDTLNTQLSRQNLIMGEFPQLAKLEAEGLLPQAEGEDAMRDVFTKFAATIDGIQQSAVQNLMEGASPEPQGGESEGDGKPVTLTVDQAWNKVVELSGGDDANAYDTAYQEYLDLLGQEQEISGHME